MTIRKTVTATAIAAVLALPATAQVSNDEPIHLKPQSPWQLDYADARCRLGRFFGEGEERTVFWLEQYGPASRFTWLVAGPAIDSFRAGRETKIQFGPNLAEIELSFSKATLEGFDKVLSGGGPEPYEEEGAEKQLEPVGLPHLDPKVGREILWLRLDQKNTPPLVFELGRMDKPFEAMNLCMEDLVTHWGIDAQAQKTRVTLPQFKNIAEVARRIQEHYPSDAVRSGSQADFHLRILVDGNGKPTGCALTNMTLAEDFDRQRDPCRIVMNIAKFEPARDATGGPIASYFESRIVYRIGR